MTDLPTHLFMPGQTINAALKRFNGHNLTAEELAWLQAEFNRVNNYPLVKPGMRLVIPLLVLPDSEGGEID